MVDRIKQLLEWQHLTPTQFADRIGIGRPVVSHILSERNKPSLDVVQRIIAAFPELSMPWLLSGTGDMLAAASPAAPTEPAPTLAPASAAGRPAAPVAAPPTDAPTAPASAKAASMAAESSVAMASIPAFRVATQVATRVATGAARPGSPARPQVVPPRFRPSQAAEPASVPTVASEATSPLATGPTGTGPLDEAAARADSPVGSSTATSGAIVEGILPAGQNQAGNQDAVPAAEPVAGLPAGAPVGPAKGDNQPAGAGLADALSAGFGEPGKAIRRIVIFYRDGSFADYQPEG